MHRLQLFADTRKVQTELEAENKRLKGEASSDDSNKKQVSRTVLDVHVMASRLTRLDQLVIILAEKPGAVDWQR